MKPILFNTEMVRAILDGRKTTTRRVIKPQPINGVMTQAGFLKAIPEHMDWGGEIVKPPYQTGDVLYVRETWYKDAGRYMFKANYSDAEKFYRAGKEIAIKWHPSIHMPREAARIFLRVTGVRAERLQEIDKYWSNYDKEGMRNPKTENISIAMQEKFISIWDSTIKKSDLPLYGWAANPWVWVIEFERTAKPDA